MDSEEYIITTKDLVDYAGSLAQWCFQHGDNLNYYLHSLARFSDYTVNNQLLVMGYDPDATYIKGYEEWNNTGAIIRQDAKPIYIIEPIKETKEFHPKYMCDVSGVDNFNHVPQNNGNKLNVLEALLTDSNHNIQVVDEVKSGVRSMYIPNEDVIRVKRSSKIPPDEFFTSIAAEMVHGNTARKYGEGVYRRATNQITAVCTAYALGIKYGIDVGNISLGDLPEKYHNLSIKQCMNELGKIRDNFINIDKQIQQSLSNILKREGLENAR